MKRKELICILEPAPDSRALRMFKLAFSPSQQDPQRKIIGYRRNGKRRTFEGGIEIHGHRLDTIEKFICNNKGDPIVIDYLISVSWFILNHCQRLTGS